MTIGEFMKISSFNYGELCFWIMRDNDYITKTSLTLEEMEDKLYRNDNIMNYEITEVYFAYGTCLDEGYLEVYFYIK